MTKPASPVVYLDHQPLTALLIQLAQDRPDLLPVSRNMISLAQSACPDLGLDMEKTTGYVLLHELGKYIQAPPPEPLRIAKCDLPSGILISKGAEIVGPETSLTLALSLPAPALVVALIAWCELQITADGKLMTLHQRRLYMDRHYGSDHAQYLRWLALRPLAQRIAETLQ